MKKMLVVFLFLSGCASQPVPVVQKFPNIPQELKNKCNPLIVIEKKEVSIVDFTEVVAKNYTQYHTCSAIVDSWQEWYTAQKKIFDSVEQK